MTEAQEPQTTPSTQEPEAAPQTAASVGTPPAELEALLREAELRAAEHHDAWLRAKAEAENARRRAQEEIEKARKYALEKFAAELLAVKDSLEAALAVGEGATLESIRSGVELTLKQLNTILERHHIREVNPLGERFDPHLHQAIAMEPGEGDPNTVANVLQKGYLLHDRVLRPALVTVREGKS